MKITKWMLADMRVRALEADRVDDVVRIDAGEFLAILNERRALRDEVRRLREDIGDVGGKQSEALSLGDDE